MRKIEPYIKEGKTLVPHPENAALIREAINIFNRPRHPLSAVNIYLSKATEQLISRERTKRILTDPALAGHLKIDGVLIPDPRIVEPYLTVEGHERFCNLVAREKGNPKYRGEGRPGGIGLASQIAFCGKCDSEEFPGVRMVNRNKPSPAYICSARATRGCPNSHARLPFDRALAGYLERRILDEDAVIRPEDLDRWQARVRAVFARIVIYPADADEPRVEFFLHNGTHFSAPRNVETRNRLGKWVDPVRVLHGGNDAPAV
jgi:hypothetical protein